MKQQLITFWSWRRACPQLLSLSVLILAFWLAAETDEKPLAMVAGALTFLLYSRLSRHFIASEHRKGVAAMARRDFEDALRHFQASYAFFSRHAWIDRYRAIALMSPSNWGYREMALLNMAAAFAQQGDIAAALAKYQDVLKEFPENQYAADALHVLEAARDRV